MSVGLLRGYEEDFLDILEVVMIGGGNGGSGIVMMDLGSLSLGLLGSGGGGGLSNVWMLFVYLMYKGMIISMEE